MDEINTFLRIKRKTPKIKRNFYAHWKWEKKNFVGKKRKRKKKTIWIISEVLFFTIIPAFLFSMGIFVQSLVSPMITFQWRLKNVFIIHSHLFFYVSHILLSLFFHFIFFCSIVEPNMLTKGALFPYFLKLFYLFILRHISQTYAQYYVAQHFVHIHIHQIHFIS